MKIIILALLNLSFIVSYAQKQNFAQLQLIYPRQIDYDSIQVFDENHNLKKATSTSERKFEFVSNYRIPVDKNSESVFSIYFGGSHTGTNDTLFFRGKEKQLKIKLEDSFALREKIKMELTHVYNFEELYYRYALFMSDLPAKYDSLKKNNQADGLSRQKYHFTSGLDFVRNNISNPYTTALFSVFIINDPFYPVTFEEANGFYKKYMEEHIKERGAKEYIENYINALKNRVREGVRIPDFLVHTLDGELVDNHTLSGKNTLLVFWASWCQPCMQEIPALKEIYAGYKDKNLRIIGVSIDTDSLSMINAIKKKEISWEQVFGAHKMAISFRINAIPHTFLIDENGIIRYNSLERINETEDLSVLKAMLQKKLGK